MRWLLALQALLRVTLFRTSECNTNEISDLVLVNFWNLPLSCDLFLDPAFYRVGRGDFSIVHSTQAASKSSPIRTVIVSIEETIEIQLPITRAPFLHPSLLLSAPSSTPASPLASARSSSAVAKASVTMSHIIVSVANPQRLSDQKRTWLRSELAPLLPMNTAPPSSPLPLARNFFGRAIDAAAARALRPKPKPKRFSQQVVDLFHSKRDVTAPGWLRNFVQKTAKMSGDETTVIGLKTPRWMNFVLHQLAEGTEGTFTLRVDNVLTEAAISYKAFTKFALSFWRNQVKFIFRALPISVYKWLDSCREKLWDATRTTLSHVSPHSLRRFDLIYMVMQDPTREEYRGLERAFPSLVWLNATRQHTIATREHITQVPTFVQEYIIEDFLRNRNGLWNRILWFLYEYVIFKTIIQAWLSYGFYCWLWHGISADFDTSNNVGWRYDENGRLYYEKNGTVNIDRDSPWNHIFVWLSAFAIFLCSIGAVIFVAGVYAAVFFVEASILVAWALLYIAYRGCEICYRFWSWFLFRSEPSCHKKGRGRRI